MISDLEKTHMRVGFKQAVRAVKEGKACKVFLTEDCSDDFKRTVEEAVGGQTDVEIYYIQSMRELGNMCGIEVGASCAAILKN